MNNPQGPLRFISSQPPGPPSALASSPAFTCPPCLRPLLISAIDEEVVVGFQGTGPLHADVRTSSKQHKWKHCGELSNFGQGSLGPPDGSTHSSLRDLHMDKNALDVQEDVLFHQILMGFDGATVFNSDCKFQHVAERLTRSGKRDGLCHINQI